MVVKTFRGLLADGGQDQIRLQTIKGKVGYRIVKFEVVAKTPLAGDAENVLKIYKQFQTSIDATINFTDSDLLGAAIWVNRDVAHYFYNTTNLFDREIFNQDIYITNAVNTGTESINYYLELEIVPLDDAGAEYTTLKDMRAE